MNNRKAEHTNRTPHKPKPLKNRFNKNGIKMENQRPTKPKPIKKEEPDE